MRQAGSTMVLINVDIYNKYFRRANILINCVQFRNVLKSTRNFLPLTKFLCCSQILSQVADQNWKHFLIRIIQIFKIELNERIFIQMFACPVWIRKGSITSGSGGGGPWPPDLEATVIQFGGPVYNWRAKQWILGPFFIFFSKIISSIALLGISSTFHILLLSLFHNSSSYVHTSTSYWLKP